MTDPHGKPPRLEIFTGEATPASARLYVKLLGLEDVAGVTVSGTVRGPICAHSRTLQATIPLADQSCQHAKGPGEVPVGAALIPDPCYWTPELPFLYRVDVRCRRGDKLLLEESRTLGLRPLGLRGHQFYLAGQPWMLRGVRIAAGQAVDLGLCHENNLAIWICAPDEPMCRDASDTGVAMVADLTSAGLETSTALARLTDWSCVVAAAVSDAAGSIESLRRAAPHLLLITAGPSEQLGDLTLSMNRAELLLDRPLPHPTPWIAVAPEDIPASLEAVIERLDELEQQLAPATPAGIFLG